jgi:hypothetical protein
MWRKAVRTSLRADPKQAGDSLEWLSHHPDRGSLVVEAPEAELNLGNMGLTSADLRGLCDWLPSRKLQVPIKINLTHGNFDNDECVELLVKLLTTPSCVSELDLSDCQLSKSSIAKICEALKTNTTLRKLTLSGNRTKGCGGAVAAMLRGNETLSSLGLAGGLGYQSIRSIAQALETNSSLEVLDLSGNHYGFKGVQALAQMLKKNKTLVDLNLVSVDMDHGFKTLCKALKSGTVLESLHLGQGCVFAEQSSAVQTMLKENKTLKHLKIIKVARSVDGTHNDNAKFWQGVGENSVLRSLKVERLGITGAQALATMLKNPHSHIESIDLSLATIGDEEAAILMDAMLANKTLISFTADLSETANPDAMQDIEDVTARNQAQMMGNAFHALLVAGGAEGSAQRLLPKDLAGELGNALALADERTRRNVVIAGSSLPG